MADYFDFYFHQPHFLRASCFLTRALFYVWVVRNLKYYYTKITVDAVFQIRNSLFINVEALAKTIEKFLVVEFAHSDFINYNFTLLKSLVIS